MYVYLLMCRSGSGHVVSGLHLAGDALVRPSVSRSRRGGPDGLHSGVSGHASRRAALHLLQGDQILRQQATPVPRETEGRAGASTQHSERPALEQQGACLQIHRTAVSQSAFRRRGAVSFIAVGVLEVHALAETDAEASADEPLAAANVD